MTFSCITIGFISIDRSASQLYTIKIERVSYFPKLSHGTFFSLVFQRLFVTDVQSGILSNH